MGKRSNNYVYFKRDWFNNLIDNKYDIEMYYDFCEMSLAEFADKIRERNKAKKANHLCTKDRRSNDRALRRE